MLIAWQMPALLFLVLSADARKLGDTESRHPLGCHGVNGLLCTELIDTKLYRPTCRDVDASRSKYNLVRLSHCKCKSLMQRSSRLSSVCLSIPRQISKTKGDMHEISSPLEEIGVTKQEYDAIFCIRKKKKKYDNMVFSHFCG